MLMKKNNEHISELRQDIVTGEWVLIAPERFHPEKFLAKKGRRVAPPASRDIFRDPFLPQVSGEVIARIPSHGAWRVAVIENKYPAASPAARRFSNAPAMYPVRSAIGRHELVITKGIRENFPRLSDADARGLFKVFRDRYRRLMREAGMRYISVFHNWGPGAGASVFHPHYQILGVPLVPSHIEDSLRGSAKYFKKHKRCAHCDMISAERRAKSRIIFESTHAIAFAPFASKNLFEVRVFPKKHSGFFNASSDVERDGVALILKKTLMKMEKNLGDPDYNFYIHTSPIGSEKKNGHYHWHIEIVPRAHAVGGFEFGTGLYVNVADPDLVAKILRK